MNEASPLKQELISDPLDLIRHSDMSRVQVVAVALTAALSALDGYDLLSITFVAPTLAKEFHASSGALGQLLSSGLAGTLLGSFGLATLADQVGRRPIAIVSLAIMAAGMLLSAFCHSLGQLALVRVFTGVGIGAMVVIVNPIAAEFSNDRLRSFVLSLKSIGYPLGGMCGGWAAALLLRSFDWRAVFVLGAAIALILFPFVIWGIPETMSFLLSRRDDATLGRVNRLLLRLGHAELTSLPPVLVRPEQGYREILGGRQLGVTLVASFISLCTWVAIYFFLSWQTKILVDLGIGITTAASIAGASSFAGACGVVAFAFLARRFDGLHVSITAIMMLGLAIIAFGLVPSYAPVIVTTALLAGASGAASTVALYIVASEVFAPRMLATGTGFMLGIGRIGSAISPSVAGGLFSLGLGRGAVASVMGVCALVAAAALTGLARSRSTS